MMGAEEVEGRADVEAAAAGPDEAGCDSAEVVAGLGELAATSEVSAKGAGAETRGLELATRAVDAVEAGREAFATAVTGGLSAGN